MTTHSTGSDRTAHRVNVVLFTGGRGSTVLARELVTHDRIDLTLVINGYDDGKSTGEVRRFLGDALGPSDFRKNAARLASLKGTASTALIDLLDTRLPVGCDEESALTVLRAAADPTAQSAPGDADIARLLDDLHDDERRRLATEAGAFLELWSRSEKRFTFADCALGNLAFAGAYYRCGREFNRTVEVYSELLGLPSDMIQNVTDGANAILVALTSGGRLLRSEAEIVDEAKPRRVEDLFLIDSPVTDEDGASLEGAEPETICAFLATRAAPIRANPVVLERLASADLVIYSAGTQNSSLLPSYLTPGVGEAIAGNLGALKLLITNIHEDAEIPDLSAVQLIDRAVFHLQRRGELATPAPWLITHYMLNDPASREASRPYVPLGSVEALEDPRLVRIGHYEDGVSGRHNAEKVLTPYLRRLLDIRPPQRVTVALLETESLNKLSQTILEALRAGIGQMGLEWRFVYHSPRTLDAHITDELPVELQNVHDNGRDAATAFREALQSRDTDYVILFDSSSMYRGEDLASIGVNLEPGRLASVWGSRRLSVRDIRESYRTRFRNRRWFGAISYLGSHMLGVLYLLLYGRYISDTLTGVRAVKARYVRHWPIDVTDGKVNQLLLGRVLRDHGETLETPVQFLPLSPGQVRRITIKDGVQSLMSILSMRLRRNPNISEQDDGDEAHSRSSLGRVT